MIYGILLAAGTSTRMGQPKQLLNWQGQPLIRHVVRQALASRIDGLVVVLGAEAPTVRAALSGLGGPLQTVENSAYLAGQAGSLQVGLNVLPAAAQAALVLLVDQPLIGPQLINQIIETYRQSGAPAVVPRYAGQRGNPVLLDRSLFGELKSLQGDLGARALLQRHAAAIHWLDLNDPAVITDIDTPEEYQRIQEEMLRGQATSDWQPTP